VWIGCDVPSAPLPIPPGETPAAFPPEPTRLRVRAASDGQGRLLGRLEEAALMGAWDGARQLRLQFVPFDLAVSCELWSLYQANHPITPLATVSVGVAAATTPSAVAELP
jgi:hypothetical protein